MIMRGIDLPRRVGVERLAPFSPEQSDVLARELQALDQNVREILSRIETNRAAFDDPATFTQLPSGLFIPQIVSSLPALPNINYPEGALVVLTSDWKLYRNAAGTWTAAVPTVDLTGLIDLDTQITGTLTAAFAEAGLINANVTINSDGTLTGAGGGQASLTQLPGQVQVGSIAANAVTAGTIAALAVTTVKIDALAVTAAKVAAGAIETDKLAANAVTADKIAANTITAAQIAAGAIGADELQANSVTAGKIDANAVTAGTIAANAISAATIQAGAVTSVKIAAGQIVASHISVTSLSTIQADMGTLTAGKIDVGNIEINANTEQILFGAATAPTLGVGIFLGLSGGVYHLRAGDPSGSRVHWDGTEMLVNGARLTLPASGSSPSLLGWSHDMVFSATDNDTVAWTSGTIRLQNGQTYSIGSGNTGNIGAVTYVYLDTDVSTTALQTTTTNSDAVGHNKILVAVVAPSPSGKDAEFQVFGGSGAVGISKLITADLIAANAVTANEIAANTITTGQLAAGVLSASNITAGTLIAGVIVASTSFTAANPVFTGNLIVEAGAGNERVELLSMSGGVIRLTDGADVVGGLIGAFTTAFSIESVVASRPLAIISAGDLILDVAEDFFIVGLPTSNPGGSGIVWNDGGTLKIT